MFSRILSFCFFCLFCSGVVAQNDSLLITYEQFIQQVVSNHPIAKQIRVQLAAADLNKMAAQGNFDPKLGANWDFKQFDNKNYFNILQSHLKIPVYAGIEAEVGYNYARGYYLNPENKLPSAGQAYLGIKLPLLKGLWTNERQATLQKASILQQASAVAVITELNDLLYKAAKYYWEWTKAFNNYQLALKAAELTEKQLFAVRGAFRQGDLPAIDTLKVYIQYQERQVLIVNTEMEMRLAANNVAQFLWDENDTPMQLSPGARPVGLQEMVMQPLADDLLENNLTLLEQHPQLQLYAFKLQQLLVEQRLKRNKLLPKLDLKYNVLATNHVNFFDKVGPAAPIESYKLGVKFSMPIFIRKERAELQMNQLKQKELNYFQAAKRQELKTKLENSFYQTQTIAQQTVILQQMVDNYQNLLQAERVKLSVGESSVFLVLTRQNQLLEAQIKQVKQQIEYLKSRTTFFWVCNILNQ